MRILVSKMNEKYIMNMQHTIIFTLAHRLTRFSLYFLSSLPHFLPFPSSLPFSLTLRSHLPFSLRSNFYPRPTFSSLLSPLSACSTLPIIPSLFSVPLPSHSPSHLSYPPSFLLSSLPPPSPPPSLNPALSRSQAHMLLSECPPNIVNEENP